MDVTSEPSPTLSMPEELESPRAKLIYCYLSSVRRSRVDELCETLDIDKGPALTILRTLRERGLVEKDGDRYKVTN